MTIFWRREIDYLKKRCDDRDAPELPPVVGEWFDLNRQALDVSGLDEEARLAVIQSAINGLEERLAECVKTFRMHDGWKLHADAYGWRFLLQPYTRAGVRFYLLCAERGQKPSDRDLSKLDKVIVYMGADPEDDFLMTTRGDDDLDVQDFWTWKVP